MPFEWKNIVAVLLLGLVNAVRAQIHVEANEFMMPAMGQHLIVDLGGSSFDALNDEMKMKQATLNIVTETGMTLLGINSFKLEPQGVSVVATLAESHLTIHTWPEHGKALVDLFTCGAGFNLQKALIILLREYEGDIDQSTFSVIPRGDYLITEENKHEKIHDQFQPLAIMGTHKYKNKVFDSNIDAKGRHVAVWDHHYDPATNTIIVDNSHIMQEAISTRSLFLDGDYQSSVRTEKLYHEHLVHPAFVASSVAPKRVLIVGGGQGASLREALKWNTVEQITMVEPEKQIVQASREYLPSYNDCTGFGGAANVCLDNEGVELVHEEFAQWFGKAIGNDMCDNRDQKKDKLYDVVIVDPISSNIDEMDEIFFQRIACSMSDLGVVVTSFGDAPTDAIHTGGQDLELFSKKVKQIQTMSSFFRHSRVYETHVSTMKGNQAFAIGMVPNLSNKNEEANVGINIFDEGSPALINMKLSQGLHPDATLEHYDGASQQLYRYPTSGWYDVYCLNTENENMCIVPKQLLNEVSSLDGAVAANISLPASEVQELKEIVDGNSNMFSNFFKFFETSSSDAPNGTDSSASISDKLKWTREMFSSWNPVAFHILGKLDKLVITTGDPQKIGTDEECYVGAACETDFS